MNTPDEVFDTGLTLYERRLEAVYRGREVPASVNWQDLRARFAQATRPGPANLTIRLMQDQLLKERYRVLEQVGRGGFAAVYKAEDLQFRQRLVALKEMSQNGLSPEELAEDTEAFQREAQMLASLRHPHLPHIYDHFEEDGRWYLVMDFIEGETLEAYLLRQREQQLPLKAVLEIGLQLCSVLEYLHTRRPPIIFRDLKPANIMRGASGHLYLIDFGIARHFKPGQIKDTIPFGSPGYAAPEQYGKAQTTQQSDIYSLGVLLHHLLSGLDPAEKPFLLAPLRLSGPAALEELVEMISHMTHLDAALRPASIAEVQAELQRLATPNADQHRGLAPLRSLPERRAIPENEQKRFSGNQEHVFAAEKNTERPFASPARPSRRKFVLGTVAASAAAVAGAGSLVALIARRRIEGASLVNPSSQAPSVATTPGRPTGTFVTSQRLLLYRGHANSVVAVAWSPKGDLVASADSNSSLQVWYVQNGVELSQTNLVGIQSLDWSPDGKYLAAVDTLETDGSVRAWNPLTDQVDFIYQVDTNGVWAVAYSPDGQLIGVGSYDGIHVLDVSNGSTVFQDKTPAYAQVRSIAWSGDGSVFAWVCSSTQQAKVWHRGAMADTVYAQGKYHAVSAVGISPNGTLLALGQQNGQIFLWNIAEQRIVLTYTEHVDIISVIRWSPNGKYVASASEDSRVRVWDPLTGKTLTDYRGHLEAVNSLAWSPDSTRIVSGSNDKSVQIWKALPV